MSSPALIESLDEFGVALLTLNRTSELNAWTYLLEDAFFAALDRLATDPAVRVVVVTGAGRAFCAGASLSLLSDGPQALRTGDPHRRRLCELTEYPKPVVAAVNGAAAGIGFALAVACDVRIAAEDAAFTTSFARLALVAEHGTAWLLPRLVGRGHALDLLMSGRVVTGTEAASIGLVTRAVTPGTALEAALAYARTLAAGTAPSSWATIKRQVLDAELVDINSDYARAAALMVPALASADHREGLQAMRERRPPHFGPLGGTGT